MYGRSRALFDEPPIGPWLPDEIIFSLASRHHRLSGNHRDETTCLQLFGHRQQGCAHDLPSRIDEFVQRTQGALGNAETIICRHTILPYYLPLRSRATAQAAIAALRSPSIGSLKFRLGILTSRFRAHHPLKACPDCMRDDQARWQIAYWHRSHQLPGYWLCTKHQRLLMECDLKSTGVGRFSWLLPDPDHLRLRVTGCASPDGTLAALSEAAEGLCELKAGALDPQRLRQVHLAALQSHGLASLSGRIAARDMARAYLAFAASLRVVPELSSLPTTEDEAGVQVKRLLYPPRTGTHPVRHLLLAIWLHGTWASFLRNFRDWNPREPIPSCADSSPEKANEAMRLRVLELVLQKGSAVSSAARAVGVATNTAAKWVVRAGHDIARRPKSLRGPARRRIRSLLKIGLDVPAVAAAAGFSQSTINRMLGTEPDLHVTWKDAKLRRARKTAREAWLACRATSPLSGTKVWRDLEPAAYAWLYRNDRTWLKSQSCVPRRAAVHSSGVRWDERDLSMADAVHRVALKLHEVEPDARLTAARLCQELPELRARIRHLDRLPLTRAAFVEIRKR